MRKEIIILSCDICDKRIDPDSYVNHPEYVSKIHFSYQIPTDYSKYKHHKMEWLGFNAEALCPECAKKIHNLLEPIIAQYKELFNLRQEARRASRKTEEEN